MEPTNLSGRSLGRRSGIAPLALLCLALIACDAQHPSQRWQLSNVSGHLPDLNFTLSGDRGKPVSGSDLRGKVILLYFGYTHCPDVCPLALTHLHVVMQRLGAQADELRIAFVSLDPARDTPALLEQYTQAFDARAIGLTGTEQQLSDLAKAYRVAFSRQPANADGSYEVNHSSAVFVFDRLGHARLISTSADNMDALTHDLQLLLEESE